MSEHVHEWEVIDGEEHQRKYTYCSCRGCYGVMEWNEIQRRLNATERLSAEDARRLMDLSRSEYEGTRTGERMLAAADAAEAYASALEGE